ncbi:hypothetical protein CROQUDRAFT_712801 [Cronartium quercuum f. sp. fusiforme G11]|uniref:Uncharacterized protein n=1 Tax=Cronartium quercuum f. sp. fusiforme G11 TaxID=708437 RepID=A0A9P6NY34_9BASI|nr:hypothetical protein CROQUDRAFT_712801 [Cronartium quercuum f. sp. fusiforme G11]
MCLEAVLEAIVLASVDPLEAASSVSFLGGDCVFGLHHERSLTYWERNGIYMYPICGQGPGELNIGPEVWVIHGRRGCNAGKGHNRRTQDSSMLAQGASNGVGTLEGE